MLPRNPVLEIAVLKRLAVCVALFVCCGMADAQGTAQWVEGTHYFRVAPAQPTSTPGKVEVLEVFSYACPACNHFEPAIDKLKAALPAGAQMAYLPASFNPQEDWPVFQRAFLTAQSLGVAEKTHDAMYDAVWSKGTLAIVDKATGHLLPKQPTIEDMAGFYAHYGVKEADFLATAKSFGIDSQMRRADQQVMDEQVMSTPTLIVNGKYRLTPQSAGGVQQMIDLALYLVAREKAGG
jgi:thiol:disulfide interchange protein DsbA